MCKSDHKGTDFVSDITAHIIKRIFCLGGQMKKQLVSLLALALTIASATVNATVQLTPSASTVNSGDSFTVNVQAAALVNIDSASVKFAYDQAVVRLDGITLSGGAAFCDLVVRDAVPNDGQVEGIFALAHQPAGEPPCPALTGTFVAFQIQMTAIAEGNASLAITQDSAGFGWTSEDNPGVIIAAANTTAAPIQIAVTASPVVDTDNDGVVDSIDNCVNTANADQADNGGLDSITADGIGDACQCGDVNNDGKVTNTDAVLIKRFLLNLPSPFNGDFCDVNGDNNCSNTDAVIIQRALLNLPPGISQTCIAAGN